MLFRLLLLLAALPAFASAAPVNCGALLVASRAEQVKVPQWQASRRVGGEGRLYFHTAPDGACRQRDLFVVPGDALEAHFEYGTYTEVVYVHPKTGRESTGWVETGRLQESMGGRGASR
ncbi:hypothetical protein ACHMW6_15930 [Pseudoduganella sp. UC29_106]|uniref:hypothetical protein n=1 Tax=Pseudoduganella sp. UC29_106 TaxID=3374553 RepID=UPI00375804E6